jgi:hypothetical protein
MAQRKRKGGAPPPSARKIPIYIWVLLVALGGAIVLRVATATGGSQHPDPRPGVTAEFVVDGERYASAPAISSTYTMAAAIPNVLDGLFCYCDCAANFGHRSLLTCFESDHGAGCDVCLQEAAMAYRMTQDGASLDQIRAQIDATFAAG